MSSEAVVGIVVGVTAGVIGAVVGNSYIRRLQEDIHQEELEEAESKGYERGFKDLSSNPSRMRKLLDAWKEPETEEA